MAMSPAGGVFVKTLVLIIGLLVATAGGVTTYRALYVEPRAGVVITESGSVRELPNYKRVIAGALMLVCGTAVALVAAKKMTR
jgi:hypothetical protein